MLKRLFLSLLLTLAVATTALAGAPETMNFQGRLTDGVDPVADGNYSVTFTIYDAAGGGNSKWTEIQDVATVGGLFTVILGTVNPIPDTVFNQPTRWLGIAVEADAEMTPRTPLSAVPYAARVATVDGASGGEITGEVTVSGTSGGNQLYVNNAGLGRGGFFQISNGANTEAAVQGTNVGGGPGGSFFSDGGGAGIVASATGGLAGDFQGAIRVGGDFDVLNGVDSVIRADASLNALVNYGNDGNGENWRLWGNSYGELWLRDNQASNNLMVDLAALSAGGSLKLQSSGGADYIRLNAGTTGDDAAVLPVNAISAAEMLDEPGASSNKSGAFALSGLNSTLVLRTFTCPAAGYVLVIGSGDLESTHTNGVFDQTTIWVSDTAGASTNQPATNFQVSGNAPSGTYGVPYCVQGIFTVTAGSHTFYVRGTNNSANVTANNNRLTLVYLPTAYGTITSNVATQLGDDPQASLSAQQEKSDADAFNMARLQDEIAAQQARLKQLADQVQDLQNAGQTSTDR